MKRFDSLFITVEVQKGTNISRVAVEVCDLANFLEEDIHFKFNEVAIVARPGMLDVEVARQYWNTRS